MGLGLGLESGLGFGLDVAIRPSLATLLDSFRSSSEPLAAAALRSACLFATLMLVVACGWVDWCVSVGVGVGVGVGVEEGGSGGGLFGGEGEADQEGICGNICGNILR